MARLPMLSPEPDDPRLRALFDEVRERRARIPNLYRVLGHSPAMLRAWLDLAWPLRLESTTPRRLREMMILRGAAITETSYEWVHHKAMAREAGVTGIEIEALRRGEIATSFSAPEAAALRLAEEVTVGPAASAATIDALKPHFSEAEIVELVLTASFYVCVGRMLKSLGVPLETGE